MVVACKILQELLLPHQPYVTCQRENSENIEVAFEEKATVIQRSQKSNIVGDMSCLYELHVYLVLSLSLFHLSSILTLFYPCLTLFSFCF